MNLPLYDAHNHLQDQRFAAALPSIIIELGQLPLRHVVVNGTRPEDWPFVAKLASQYPWIIPSYGLHPWYVNQTCENWQAVLEEYLRRAPAAIGEVGLDRWIEGFDSPKQEAAFIWQLQLAKKLRRPVTIHCLKAWGRILEILKEEQLPCGFLLHSYGGPVEMVPAFAELGGYFSLSGFFAHERKERQRSIFRTIPIGRLLIETDAPDMALPAEQKRYFLSDSQGKDLNHPADILAVYQFAAELCNIDLEELTITIERNFLALFRSVLSSQGLSPADNP